MRRCSAARQCELPCHNRPWLAVRGLYAIDMPLPLRAELGRVLIPYRHAQGRADRQLAWRQRHPQPHRTWRWREDGLAPRVSRPNNGIGHLPTEGLSDSRESTGHSPFLSVPNAPAEATGDEVTSLVRWMTGVRSQSAQPGLVSRLLKKPAASKVRCEMSRMRAVVSLRWCAR